MLAFVIGKNYQYNVDISQESTAIPRTYTEWQTIQDLQCHIFLFLEKKTQGHFFPWTVCKSLTRRTTLNVSTSRHKGLAVCGQCKAGPARKVDQHLYGSGQ